MIEIISKNGGPRKEDAAAKDFLRRNSTTINKIADQLAGGRPRVAKVADTPQNADSSRRQRGSARPPDDKSPYTHISLNGRVVVVDFNSGRQLHHIGEIRGRGASRRLALASAENGFFSPLDPDLLQSLRDLDGAAIVDDALQDALVRLIDQRLGFATQSAAAQDGG